MSELKQMKAAVYQDGQLRLVEDYPVPVPAKGEALIKVLQAGDYTFASLLYSQSLVEAKKGLYHVKTDHVGSAGSVPNPDTASLVIHFPDRDGNRDGVEQIRRSCQVCSMQAKSIA